MDGATRDPVGGVTVRAVGPATDNGRISLSELARIAGGLQATLERIAYAVMGGKSRLGRMPQHIADAVRLDFAGYSSGSAVLQMVRPEAETLDDLLTESFNTLANGLEHIRQDREGLPQYFTPVIINGLVDLCGGISPRNMSSVEFIADSGRRFQLDPGVQGALRRVQKSASVQDISIVGRLHMGDFDPMSLRCRIDTLTASVTSDFDDGLRESIFELLDSLVIASGSAEMQADGVTVRVLHLDRIDSIETAASKDLDELAAEQGVSPVNDPASLRGEPIDDFDEFLAIVKSAR